MKAGILVVGFLLPILYVQLSIAAAAAEAVSPVAAQSLMYIKNGSEYPVRVSVGSEYPSSIALYPGQIIEFPLKNVQLVHASTYGKISHVFTGLVAELDVAKLLQEHPEYSAKNCLVEITYKTPSVGSIWNPWGFARYMFTSGAWLLNFNLIDSVKICTSVAKDTLICQKIYEKIKWSTSDPIAESVARDAALIWSIFPRAAEKIISQKTVYPFNILGLDIGGLVATDKQLRNWGALLASSLKKNNDTIVNPIIWNAINMIIADSIDSLRHHNYYAACDPERPVTLLHIPGSDFSEAVQEPGFPIELIDELKGKVGEDPSTKALVDRLEEVARLRGWTSLVRELPSDAPAIAIPPAPPAPPAMMGLGSLGNYQEKAVMKFLNDLLEKRPEEQVLLDKVVQELFQKIDVLPIDHALAIRMKYAALDKMRIIEQNQHAVSNLVKIREFMSPIMIKVASVHPNPAKNVQDWISLLTQVERDKAFEYFRMEEQSLVRALSEQQKQQDYQSLLMVHLKEQIKKFESLGDSSSDKWQ